MRRLVVKEVPKESTPIQPSKSKPGFTEVKENKVTNEQGEIVAEEVSKFIPWKLDSRIATLIGEAKSLPKGLSLKLVDVPGIALNEQNVAWYTNFNSVDLLRDEGTYFLSRRDRKNRKGKSGKSNNEA